MLLEAFSRMPDVFDNKTLLKGRDYYDQGKVLNIRLSDGLLKARVKGSSGQIYNVHMDLKIWPQQAARCSCRVEINCKHAAASLFVFHERERQKRKPQESGKLDRKLDIWLKNLSAQEKLKPTQQHSHRLTYLIELRMDGHEHKLLVRLALSKILKKGDMGKKIVFNQLSNSKKQHFVGEDEDIVAQLMYRAELQGWFDAITIRNGSLLEKIINTGRAFFEEDSSDPIKAGKPLSAECKWKLLPNGRQRIQLQYQEQKLTPLLLDEPWYLDKDNHCLGKLDIPYPSRQLHHLLEAPPVSLDQAETLAKKMSQTFADFPSPLSYENRQVHQIKPEPYLIFNAIDFSEVKSSARKSETQDASDILYTIEPGFSYAGIRINADDLSEQVVNYQEGILHQYQRDEAFEKSRMDELNKMLPSRRLTPFERRVSGKGSSHQFVLETFEQHGGLDSLYQDIIPDLKSKGWTIELQSSVYEEIIDEDAIEWFSELNDSGHDFFSYQLGIVVDGRTVSIVPLVVELIGQYGSGNVLDQLPDTQLVDLPLGHAKVLRIQLGRIKPLIRLLLQYGLRHISKDDQQLKISRYQVLLMQEAEQAMAATSARWQGADDLRQRLLQLANKDYLPEIPIPKGLNATLRDYQHEGLNWLQFLRQNHFGGVLADDMGLGKTVQTLAHLQYEKEQGRLNKACLIIAPTSLVGNWQAEAKRFTPDLKLLVFHGSDRYQDDFDAYDIVVSTYGLVQRDKSRFLDYQFYYLILDESQFIKNARTKTTQIIQQIPAVHRLCLTGTPLENHLGELWSLFHFLMPGLLGDSRQFRQWFKTPIEKHADVERRHLLANRIKPFILRRNKNEVAKELPPKTEMTHRIKITGAQRDLYEAIRMSMEKKVREAIAKQGLNKSHIVLLDALLKLRQVCCDPRLLSLPDAKMAHGSSAKLDALMELLDNLMEEDRRVLIFSQFTSMLALIEEELKKRQYSYLKLTGQTQNRQALVERFQQGDVPIFLISLKAGGTGLNLTRADTVIHYDPWWNPAVEDQATDRSHRIGQDNPVFVYKLITEGTVEEVILGMQEKKRQLVEGVLSSDVSGIISLTDQDIREFFTPL